MLSAAIMCMALTIFHEARGEGLEGQVAVAYVTHHRAKSKPSKYCSVVSKKGQYSWWGQKTVSPKEKKSWDKAIAIARTFQTYPDKTKGALFFHEKVAKPAWRKSMQLVTIIGRHWFYSPENTS